MKFWRLWSRRRAREADLERELQDHLELEAEEQQDAGLPAEAAHYAARRALGNTTRIKEDVRAMWGWTSIENSLRDLRYGLRLLRRSPGFALVAVVTLALGIGANTAIFSVMNAVMLRYLPAPNPQQLVYLHNLNRPDNTSQTGDTDDVSFTEYSFEQLRHHHPGLTDVVAFVPLSESKVPVRYGREPEEARADMVSGNFFSGLGVASARGRTFTFDEEEKHAQVAVLSYSYWTARFSRNPSVIGQTLYIKTVPFTIIGVATRDFYGVEPGSQTDIWIPLQDRPELKPWGRSVQDQDSFYGSPHWWFLMMIGRLAPGVSMKRAQGELNPLFRRIAYLGADKQKDGKTQPQLYLTSVRGIEELREAYAEPLKFLMAMVGLVLVIACSNVAMLMVARNTVREREFSLRTALGASRLQLFRQLLTESALLVTAGGAMGWLFAVWFTGALAAWSEFDVNVAPNSTVLLFTLGVSVAAALVFGLAPLRSAARVPPGLVLKSATPTSSVERSKIRSGQVIMALQTALCVVLLVAAGLLLRTLQNLENANLGMRVSGLLVFGISPPQTLHSDPEVLHFFHTLTDRFRALPGVESVTLMQTRIGFGWSNNTYAYLDGVLPRPSGDESSMRWNAVGPGYFHALGIPLLLGRDLTDADTSTAPKVVVVNQTFAHRFLAGRDALGHHLAMDKGARAPQYTIVGVAADSEYTSVDERPRPMAYFPYTQIPGAATMHYELRTARSDPTPLLPEVRRVVRDFGPDLPLLQPMTQKEQFEDSYSEQRLFARLSAFFGFLAALLVATGLYGTLAYRVSRRTPEIGVRMALGAQRWQVIWMVLRDNLVVALAGAIAGLPLAIGGARLLRSTLFGVQPGDLLSFVAALAGILVVTLAASFIPARRAAKIDPVTALRCE
jgi:predicted permease